ncbi:MAG: RNA polymerase sigma factor [Candidatus Gracilibacteria bacterium]|nr:RNA polymerase sigma factor [Candidatus Gracilibacteria bacterium]
MPISELSDEELVEKAREDVNFFAPLLDRYEPQLTRYVARISNFCPETIEEILQDVFLKVWKNLNDFDGRVAFRSWIYRIAHNETISRFRWFRARGQDQEVTLDDTFPIPDKSDFIAEIDLQISAKNIQKTLRHLPKKYREILTLYFFHDLSYAEISDVLKKPTGTVATLLSRAKKSFRDTAKRLQIAF